VKTGDGPNEDAGGATRNEENVIRLPRDWLGPPEELVPIGPAARARAAQLEADGAPPPAADAFWSEDSAALHDAVQAPSGAARDHLNPPVGLVDPVAGRWQMGPPGLSRLAEAWRMRVRTRWALLAVPTVVLLILAAIGFGEQGGTEVTSGHTAASSPVRHAAAPDASSYAALNAAFAVSSGAAPARHQARPAVARSRTRAHVHEKAARPVTVHHHVPTAHHSAPAATPAVTEASTARRTSTGTTTTPVRTATPTSETASKPSSGGSSSAPAPGPTGIGSMTGGCTVKCS